MKYVIIGNGVAGVTAALSIRKRDVSGTVTIVSDEAVPYYSRPLIVDVMTGARSVRDIVLLGEEEYRVKGIDLRMPVTVKKLKKEGPLVTSQGEVPWDRLLIASGGRPQEVPLRGRGLFYLRTVGDALAIQERLRKGVKRVLIYGAGPVGIKAGCALTAAGIAVTFIVTSRAVLSRVLDKRGAALIQGLFEERGARFMTGRKVAAIIGKRGFRGIVTDGGEEVEGELLIIAKGVSPTVDFCLGAGIETAEGIIVNNRMEASRAHVYAAGDAAQAPAAGRIGTEVMALWPLASLQGRVAGVNMAGGADTYEGSVGSNSLDCFGTAAISMGVVEGAPEEIVVDEAGIYRKYCLDGNRLVGAVLIGDVRGAGILLDAIRRGRPFGRDDAALRRWPDVGAARQEVLF